jgi:hypothetical protein
MLRLPYLIVGFETEPFWLTPSLCCGTQSVSYDRCPLAWPRRPATARSSSFKTLPLKC